MARIEINIEALLSFFDEDRTAKAHSNSIKAIAGEELGFALLIEHFKSIGAAAEKLKSRCTTKGNWLDGWLKVVEQPNSETYFQVEVKCWSFHGVEGWTKPIPVRSQPDELANIKKKIWSSYWEDGQFIAASLNKVLTPMKPPVAGNINIVPLACLWAPLHREGKSEPLFYASPKVGSAFSRVAVFSMSSYLRSILDQNGNSRLILELPMAHERINRLQRLFVPA